MTFPALKVWRNTSTRNQCLSCWNFCIELLEQRMPFLQGRSNSIDLGVQALVSPLRLTQADRYELRVAALYHDIGLLGIPDELILNQAQLSAQQRARLDTHTDIGGRLLSKAFPDFPNAIEAVWYHHERPDGTGPHGLKGDQIPQMAGIIALTNAVDAMVNGGYPYEKPLRWPEVQQEIDRLSGTALLPTVAVVFRRVAEPVCDAVRRGTPVAASAQRLTDSAPLKSEWIQCMGPACEASPSIQAQTKDRCSRSDQRERLQEMEPLISKAQLKKLIDEQTELRPLAPIVQNVMAITSNPQCSVEDVTAVVQQDPALAMRVLRLANSSAYWRGRLVKYVKDAVSRIGVQEVRNTVIALGVFDQFADEEAHNHETLLFWEHSLACGLIASAITRASDGTVPHDAFLLGMLHDTGQTILKQCIPDIYDQVTAVADQLGVTLQQVEARLLGMTHGEVFQYVFARWRFTAFMIEPIVHHHTSLRQIQQLPREHQHHTIVLALADRMAQALMLGSGGIDMLYPVRELVEALRIQPDCLGTMIAEVSEELSDLKLALFCRTPSDSWPHQPSVIQSQFTEPPRVVYHGPEDPSDTLRLFLNVIGVVSDEQPPNLDVIYLRETQDTQ